MTPDRPATGAEATEAEATGAVATRAEATGAEATRAESAPLFDGCKREREGRWCE